ncbi:Uncharacterized protein At4g26485 [Linum grandiflorum]
MQTLMGRILSYILRCLCGEEQAEQSPLPPRPPPTTADDHLRSPLLRSQISDNGGKQGLFVVLEQPSRSSKPFVVLPAGSSSNNLKPASPAPPAKKVKADRQVPNKVQEKEKASSVVVIGKSLSSAVNEIWKKDYCSNQRILLVGEGDFSFSSCLALAFGSAINITATSLNTKEFLRKNYSSAMANIEAIKTRGGLVMHGVDATKMAKHGSLKGMKFDRIIFNFPHAGFSSKETPAETQILKHQKLLRSFFKNAKKLLREDGGGEIHVRHKTTGFHKQWDLEGLASDAAGLKLVATVKFKLSDYPGYNTKYGFGGDRNFDCCPSLTYKFGVLKLHA